MRTAMIAGLILLGALPAFAEQTPPPRLAGAHWWMEKTEATEGEEARPGEDTGMAVAFYVRELQAKRYVSIIGAFGQKTLGPGVALSVDVGKVVVGGGIGFVWDYDGTGIDFGKGRIALGVTMTFGGGKN